MVYRETCLLSCYLPQKHEYIIFCQRLSVTVEQDGSRYLLPVDLFVVFKSNKTKVICKVTVDKTTTNENKNTLPQCFAGGSFYVNVCAILALLLEITEYSDT